MKYLFASFHSGYSGRNSYLTIFLGFTMLLTLYSNKNSIELVILFSKCQIKCYSVGSRYYLIYFWLKVALEVKLVSIKKYISNIFWKYINYSELYQYKPLRFQSFFFFKCVSLSCFDKNLYFKVQMFCTHPSLLVRCSNAKETRLRRPIWYGTTMNKP